MYKSKVIRLRRKGGVYKPVFDIGVINRKLKSNSQKFDKIGYLIPFGKKIFAINGFKLANWLNYGIFLKDKVKLKLVKMAVPVDFEIKFKKFEIVKFKAYKSVRKYNYLYELLVPIWYKWKN